MLTWIGLYIWRTGMSFGSCSHQLVESSVYTLVWEHWGATTLSEEEIFCFIFTNQWKIMNRSTFLLFCYKWFSHPSWHPDPVAKKNYILSNFPCSLRKTSHGFTANKPKIMVLVPMDGNHTSTMVLLFQIIVYKDVW